jgi:hypothetical protein
MGNPNSICIVEGCCNRRYRHGVCRRHLRLGFRCKPQRSETSLEWLKRVALAHDADECLFWPFGRDNRGRGEVWVGNGKGGGKVRIASRLVCELTHGQPPSPNLHAAHSCGNGHLGCVNPKHLRWATLIENLEDKIRHRRWRKPTATLFSEADIRSIRSDTRPCRIIGAEHGLSASAINDIKLRRTWRRVPD